MPLVRVYPKLAEMTVGEIHTRSPSEWGSKGGPGWDVYDESVEDKQLCRFAREAAWLHRCVWIEMACVFFNHREVWVPLVYPPVMSK